MEKEKKDNKKKEPFWDFVIWGCIGAFIGLFLFPIRYSIGASMLPTFSEKAVNIGINPNLPSIEVERFDVVALSREGKENIQKRIVGLPGEHVKIKENTLYINDAVVDNPYVVYKETDEDNERFLDVILADDEYYVLGDNQKRSADSKNFGPFKKDQIEYILKYNIAIPKK